MGEPVSLDVLRLRPGARIPARQSDLASGFDLYACLEDGPLVIGEAPVRVPTGIAMATPAGIDVQVRPRSGLTARGVIAAFGTVDADFRGELHVTMYCLPSTGTFEVRDGDRIAQIVIARLAAVAWAEVDSLEETARGTGGWGSTGV